MTEKHVFEHEAAPGKTVEQVGYQADQASQTFEAVASQLHVSGDHCHALHFEVLFSAYCRLKRSLNATWQVNRVQRRRGLRSATGSVSYSNPHVPGAARQSLGSACHDALGCFCPKTMREQDYYGGEDRVPSDVVRIGNWKSYLVRGVALRRKHHHQQLARSFCRRFVSTVVSMTVDFLRHELLR